MALRNIVIVGAGPSGLAAAYEAVRRGTPPIVFERHGQVGGLARTIAHNGHRFDIGPHRFFTLNDEVRELFRDVVAEDAVRVPRLTRIFYRRKFFNYPLTPLNALFGVGLLDSVRILLSYFAARWRRWAKPAPLVSFEDWVVDRFGRRLYETFFKTYTEKVWGVPCRQIGADWANQRIKGLDLSQAILNALFKPRRKTIKTLIDEFQYPRLGAGQFYEKIAARVEQQGGIVHLETRVGTIRRDGFRILAVEYQAPGRATASIEPAFLLSSAPLTELLEQLDPPPPEILEAARSLRYRHHISVNIVVEGAAPFPDNWLYVHSPDVQMARISDYRNFSAAMGRTPDCHPMTIEYFTDEDSALWTASDEELIALALEELNQVKLVERCRVSDAMVVRSAKAYPVIETGFQAKIALLKGWLDRFENLLPIGRSGMFKYNNQDHAIATGLLAARTALGLGQFDPWLVNIDGMYQEGARLHD